MKRLALILSLVILIASCGGSDTDTPTNVPTLYTLEGRFLHSMTVVEEGCGVLSEPNLSWPGEGIEFTESVPDSFDVWDGCTHQTVVRDGNTLITRSAFSRQIGGGSLSMRITTTYTFTSDDDYTGSQIFEGKFYDDMGWELDTCYEEHSIAGVRDDLCGMSCLQGPITQ